MISLILLIVLISAVVRLVTAPFRYGRRNRFYGYGNPCGYGYGYRRRHSGLFTVLALVALDRIFGRRW